MLLLRSVLIGVLVSVATTVIWTVGEFVYVFLVERSVAVSGSGGLGAVSVGWYGPYVALVSFVVATALTYGRARGRRRRGAGRD
jgi:hypothetical protein